MAALHLSISERHPQVFKSASSPFRLSCRCGDPIGLHEEIGGNFPTCIDLLNHLKGKGAAPSQDFGRARTRAENVCKLGLTVSELLDRVAQHIHRVEPASTPERPAPFLIGLDQRHKNVELIALWRPIGRAPKLLDLGESGAEPTMPEPDCILSQSPNPNSLITGKLTGNFTKSGLQRRFLYLIEQRIQMVAAKFPTRMNREFLNGNRETFRRNREWPPGSADPLISN